MTAPAGPRTLASQYASGMPNSATITDVIVALMTDTSSADHRPGVPNPRSPGPASRTTKAASGMIRYRASSPPSQVSGLREAWYATTATGRYDDSTPDSLDGTPDPVTVGGLTRVKPSCLRTACPSGPSRYFTNASAPASCGALFRMVIV